jgi:GNAT superfamily N-acetyltransferase
MKKTRLRKGRKSDLPRVLQLVRELAAYELAPGEVEVNLSQMEAWGFGNHKIYGFFVVEDASGKIPGMALYYYKYSTWKGKCLFIEDIIVTEKERGKGYGKMLLDAVIAMGRKEKVKRIEWQVLDWNKDAIRFYRRYGTEISSEWLNCRLTGVALYPGT